MVSVNEFVDGQVACRDGDKPREKASESYLDGYSFQYQLEACQTKQSELREVK